MNDDDVLDSDESSLRETLHGNPLDDAAFAAALQLSDDLEAGEWGYEGEDDGLAGEEEGLFDAWADDQWNAVAAERTGGVGTDGEFLDHPVLDSPRSALQSATASSPAATTPAAPGVTIATPPERGQRMSPASAAVSPAASAVGTDTSAAGSETSSDSSVADGEEAAAPAAPTLGFYITPTLKLEQGSWLWDAASGKYRASGEPLRCLNEEVLWSISSARPGNGVTELLSPDVAMFWQSDGLAPHHVVMNFYKRQSIAELAVYLDYGVDESYTPSDIIIRAGNILTDCEDVVRIRVTEPAGWVRIPFTNVGKRGLQRYLRAHVLTMTVVANHQAGRDSHVRGLQVLGPAEEAGTRFGPPAFTSPALTQQALIR